MTGGTVTCQEKLSGQADGKSERNCRVRPDNMRNMSKNGGEYEEISRGLCQNGRGCCFDGSVVAVVNDLGAVGRKCGKRKKGH